MKGKLKILTTDKQWPGSFRLYNFIRFVFKVVPRRLFAKDQVEDEEG